jgi:hypothetical protein
VGRFSGLWSAADQGRLALRECRGLATRLGGPAGHRHGSPSAPAAADRGKWGLLHKGNIVPQGGYGESIFRSSPLFELSIGGACNRAWLRPA